MPTQSELAEQIAALITDYREGEIKVPDAAHVDRWIRQFPADVRELILAELAHVFDNTYFTRRNVKTFLTSLVTNEKLTGGNPKVFWSGVKFLHLQTAGNSQHEMLALFDKALQKACGLRVADCGGPAPHTYVYIDDVLFSGGRIKSDIVSWVENHAPAKATVAIITIAVHTLGQWFAGNDIQAAANKAGKSINMTWWRVADFEDRKAYMTNSDVLRPTMIPTDPATQVYVATLGQPPVLRTPGQVGPLKLFSSDKERILLEQQFLIAGVRVRGMCPHLNTYMRPLGNSLMRTTGFGSMIVTHRNCPNNAPLVLWAGDPWHPLFPRKTN